MIIMKVYHIIKTTYHNLRFRAWQAGLIGLAILMMVVSVPDPAYAQWPPFSFKLIPSFENNRIIYQIGFSSRVEWPMMDVTFKIPLPPGTRFIEAGAPPTTRFDFNGAEVTFFTAVTHKSIKDAYFIVEVTDPATTVFTTYAWITWQGDQSGNYMTEAESFDITQAPLDWAKPPRSPVQLETMVTVTDGVMTYTIFPIKTTNRRIWDLKVNVPLPEGTTFLSAEAPPRFVTNFDGREVSFSTIEMDEQAEVGPLRLEVSTAGITTPVLVTHSWTTWKNVGRSVGQTIPVQEDTRTGDLVVQPHAAQRVIADHMGDVPFANYDVSSLALGQDGDYLKIIFYTVGELGPVGEPLEYRFFVDGDCRIDTGSPENGRGVDYQLRYRHDKGRTDLYHWDEAQKSWSAVEAAEMKSETRGNMVTIWAPTDLLNITGKFCWTAEAKNRTREFDRNAPTEQVPDGETTWQLTEYELLPAAAKTRSLTAEVLDGALSNHSQAGVEVSPMPLAAPRLPK